MNEKPQECMPNVVVFLSQLERTYWSLTPQLETAISEVSTMQAQRLRANCTGHKFAIIELNPQ